jgi:hypothetical protein
MAGRRLLRGAYLAIAAVALVACWRQNLAFMSEARTGLLSGFVAFWPALLANHATTSITIDIFLFALAAFIWMVVEARVVGIRFVWLYIVLSFVIAVSVMFPLFLYARDRRLEARSPAPEQLAATDVAGLLVFGVPIVLFALYTLTL